VIVEDRVGESYSGVKKKAIAGTGRLPGDERKLTCIYKAA